MIQSKWQRDHRAGVVCGLIEVLAALYTLYRMRKAVKFPRVATFLSCLGLVIGLTNIILGSTGLHYYRNMDDVLSPAGLIRTVIIMTMISFIAYGFSLVTLPSRCHNFVLEQLNLTEKALAEARGQEPR